MTEKQYRLNKWGTRLLKNNRPLFDWANESDDIVELLNEQDIEIKRLKEELFEARKDYIVDTADISDKQYLDEMIEEERKEIYGDVE